MNTAIDLSGKVALVTGAAQGIGAATARVLHAAGAMVVLNYPGSAGSDLAKAVDRLVDELNAVRGASACHASADVAIAGEVQAMMNNAKDRFGAIDILVNNAGILRDKSVAKMSIEDWRAVIDVNLTGVFHGCKYGLEAMRDGGAIVNVGSLAATACFFGQANYAAAKAGVHALTKVAAKEAARRGIRVNAVAPGVVDTPMMQRVSEDVRTAMLKAIPMGRFASPTEIAQAILYLCSGLASYVTGSILEVHGGWQG